MIDYFHFLLFWVFIVGLCIGSFLNVVILRGLSEESIVFPPSKCPVCGNKLKWWMNIPLLSYFLLKGKCGFCKTKISLQYPIVELFTGIMFALIFYIFGISYETLFFFIAVSLIIVMSVCDIKEQIIFDLHAYFLIALGFIYSLIMKGFDGVLPSLGGAILGYVFYEILARLGYLFVKVGDDSDEDEEEQKNGNKNGNKTNDSLIAAGIGAFFGFICVLCGIESLFPSIIGAILGYTIYKLLIKFNVISKENDSDEDDKEDYAVCENESKKEDITDEKRAFGEGDSLIAAGIGAFFGWKMFLVSVFLSVVVMSVFTLPYYLLYSYKLGKKRTCVAVIFEAVLICMIYVIAKLNLLETMETVLSFFVFTILILVWGIKQILSEMNKKNKYGEISLCVMPFGPAMGVSFLMIMFFASRFETFLKSYLGY